MTRVNPALEPAAHGLHVANAAAELHLHREPGENAPDRLGVNRLPGEGAVEIDDMQIFEPLLGERPRLRGGVGVEHCRLRHVAAGSGERTSPSLRSIAGKRITGATSGNWRSAEAERLALLGMKLRADDVVARDDGRHRAAVVGGRDDVPGSSA